MGQTWASICLMSRVGGFPWDMIYWHNIGIILDQRRRHWADVWCLVVSGVCVCAGGRTSGSRYTDMHPSVTSCYPSMHSGQSVVLPAARMREENQQKMSKCRFNCLWKASTTTDVARAFWLSWASEMCYLGRQIISCNHVDLWTTLITVISDIDIKKYPKIAGPVFSYKLR